MDLAYLIFDIIVTQTDAPLVVLNKIARLNWACWVLARAKLRRARNLAGRYERKVFMRMYHGSKGCPLRYVGEVPIILRQRFGADINQCDLLSMVKSQIKGDRFIAITRITLWARAPFAFTHRFDLSWPSSYVLDLYRASDWAQAGSGPYYLTLRTPNLHTFITAIYYNRGYTMSLHNDDVDFTKAIEAIVVNCAIFDGSAKMSYYYNELGFWYKIDNSAGRVQDDL